MTWLSEIQLVGDFITLKPLKMAHIEGLKEAVLDGELWKLWYANVPSPDDMEKYVRKAFASVKRESLVFTISQNSTAKIVGTTRYYDVDSVNRRAKIGYTWYANSVQRTAMNTECKYLLLRNLFEDNNAIAVEFRTHFFNQVSRTAIERLGAKQDGILRNYMITPDSSIRDTVVYSIIISEWLSVKNNLLDKLNNMKSMHN